MKWTQPDNWAERKTRLIHQFDKNTMWIYKGSCVESDGETIDYIKADHRFKEITYEELYAEVDLSAFEQAMGYGPDFPLKGDWHVGYYRSSMPNHAPCLVLQHSGIEYIWVQCSKY